MEFDKVLCWALCYLTFSLQIFFFFCPAEIASYADDTPYTMEDCLWKALQIVEEASNVLLRWFSNSYMVANADRCHLLKSTSEEVSVKIENEIIKNF